MLSFVAQRIVKGVIVLLAIVVLNFFLIRLAPGDPAVVMAGEAGASDKVFVAQLREKFGLDKPLPEQLFIYVKASSRSISAFRFAAGAGFQTDHGAAAGDAAADDVGVRDLAGARRLLRRAGGALGRDLGGYRHHRGGAGVLCHAVVWIALMAILLFSVEVDWLPSFGYETVGANYTGFAHALDVGAHLVMPAMTIGLFFMATYTRMTRASMLEVKRLDFVKTAPRQGARRRRDPAPSRAAQRAIAGGDPWPDCIPAP